MCDPAGNIAEFTAANLWFGRGGVAITPAANHTFLAGITRRRVMALFRQNGVAFEERAVSVAELEDADEIFSTGNYAKVAPCSRYNGRDMQIGPLASLARELYFGWMETTPKLV